MFPIERRLRGVVFSAYRGGLSIVEVIKFVMKPKVTASFSMSHSFCRQGFRWGWRALLLVFPPQSVFEGPRHGFLYCSTFVRFLETNGVQFVSFGQYLDNLGARLRERRDVCTAEKFEAGTSNSCVSGPPQQASVVSHGCSHSFDVLSQTSAAISVLINLWG